MNTGDLRMRALMLDVSQAYTALLELAVFAPVQLAAVLDRAENPPQAHGENHINGAGQVVSAIVPGECITCHGHVDRDGVFHAAVA